MGVERMKSMWAQANDIENNYDYIKLIFESFNLKENVDFYQDYGDAIRFKRWRSGYEQIFRITVNEDLDALVVYMRSIKNNWKNKEKYHIYRKHDGKPWIFGGADAWYDCIKMLIRGE